MSSICKKRSRAHRSPARLTALLCLALLAAPGCGEGPSSPASASPAVRTASAGTHGDRTNVPTPASTAVQASALSIDPWDTESGSPVDSAVVLCAAMSAEGTVVASSTDGALDRSQLVANTPITVSVLVPGFEVARIPLRPEDADSHAPLRVALRPTPTFVAVRPDEASAHRSVSVEYGLYDNEDDARSGAVSPTHVWTLGERSLGTGLRIPTAPAVRVRLEFGANRSSFLVPKIAVAGSGDVVAVRTEPLLEVAIGQGDVGAWVRGSAPGIVEPLLPLPSRWDDQTTEAYQWWKRSTRLRVQSDGKNARWIVRVPDMSFRFLGGIGGTPRYLWWRDCAPGASTTLQARGGICRPVPVQLQTPPSDALRVVAYPTHLSYSAASRLTDSPGTRVILGQPVRLKAGRGTVALPEDARFATLYHPKYGVAYLSMSNGVMTGSFVTSQLTIRAPAGMTGKLGIGIRSGTSSFGHSRFGAYAESRTMDFRRSSQLVVRGIPSGHYSVDFSWTRAGGAPKRWVQEFELPSAIADMQLAIAVPE